VKPSPNNLINSPGMKLFAAAMENWGALVGPVGVLTVSPQGKSHQIASR
jgi:hypothetical protein